MGSDKYGRYSWTQFLGKKHHLNIYNVYRPCAHSDNSYGVQTLWQQHRSVLDVDNINVDSRKQILNPLSMHIKEGIANKRQVIIIGDFNSNIFENEINDYFSQIGLHNAVEYYIKTQFKARSYFTGKTIIECIWCSKIALESIRSLGLTQFYFVMPSDHCSIYCDIDVVNLLDNDTKKIKPVPYRHLLSKAPKRVDAYCA